MWIVLLRKIGMEWMEKWNIGWRRSDERKLCLAMCVCLRLLQLQEVGVGFLHTN